MKKILALLMVTALLLSSINIVFADNTTQIIGDNNTIVFVDVPQDYWAKNEIQYFASQNIVSGNGDGTFAPEDGVTREQFTKMLVLTFHAPLESQTEPYFSDVRNDRWSYSYIEVCKEFLTGYNNPFGGKPAFHPEELATREDIAVALVRMMGLTDKDASDKNYAKRKFADADNISPNLLTYVSLAAERGLISGYPDGTFGPTRGITRAETVVLLNRATKQAVTNISAELELSANVVSGKDQSQVTIMIQTAEGATVTVDGQKVNMGNNGYDMYEGAFPYKFEHEGTKTFAVVATKVGKTKSVTVTAKYEIGAPTLNVTQCPPTSNTKSIMVSGTVKDANDTEPTVTINGNAVYPNYNGNWSNTVDLAEGSNTITIIASNNLGKTTTIEKTVTFGVGAPTLTITQCPPTSNTMSITVNGTVKDTNDTEPTVTVNGKSVYPNYSGNWSSTVDLVEGSNTIIITASNNLDKTTTIEKTVTFGVGAPTLTITQCPPTSNIKSIMVNGVVKDANDTEPIVTVNGKSVYPNYNGNWSTTVDLTEGSNTITIIASNNLGKTTTIEKTVAFNVGTPTLTITQCPPTSNTKSITVSGTVKDTNDTEPTVTVNGNAVYPNYNGNWSVTVDLAEGSNTVTIIASNNLGKTTTIDKTVTYTKTTN